MGGFCYMASVINALRSISSDDWWIVKIGFFAFFVFMVIQGKEQLMKYTSI